MEADDWLSPTLKRTVQRRRRHTCHSKAQAATQTLQPFSMTAYLALLNTAATSCQVKFTSVVQVFHCLVLTETMRALFFRW